MAKGERFRILVVDDEPEIIRSFKMAFVDQWDVDGITHPDELKKDMKNGFRRFGAVDLIFLDLLFDAKVKITQKNAVESIEKGELLGVKFLDWLAEYFAFPVVVLSGFLFEAVTRALRARYPYILLKAKPVDLNENTFRHNMEYYAETFYRTKYQMLFHHPAKELMRQVDELLEKKPG